MFASSHLRRVLRIALLALTVPWGLSGQDAASVASSETPDQILERLNLEFDVERAELLTPQRELAKIYTAQLKELLAEKTKAADLEKALAVRNELEGFQQGKSVAAGDDFPELKRIQEIYAAELAKRKQSMAHQLGPIIRAHKQRLLTFQKSLTQEGKLNEALKVKAVYDKVTDIAGSEAALVGSHPMASRGQPFENSLGMKFVPVPITGASSLDHHHLLFSVWETRVRDYAAFLKKVDRPLRETTFKQGDDHPVVWTTADDADAFCIWLTERERKSGKIGPKDLYRLPSDHEWSCAAGIGDKENPEADPMSKSRKLADVYFWGTQWPPPNNVGNILGEETLKDLVSGRQPIAGFSDGYRETAPVGTYPANQFGLFDVGGNVCEVCSDWGDPNEKKRRIIRDAAWRNHQQAHMLSSNRISGGSFDHIGFRCVLETGAAK